MNEFPELRFRAFAKINLTLSITGKRPDGYHLLSTVMQSVSLFDTVSLSCSGVPGEIRITCSDPSVPCGSRNTVWKAADRFFAAAALENPGIRVHIEKKIPQQAGMGGGSADAAAVLYGLNRVFGKPLTVETLMETAASVGADVPFCITGGTQLARGIGEVLSPLHAMKSCPIVIVKPPFSSSTAEAYRAIDEVRAGRLSSSAAENALKCGNLSSLAGALYNAFEAVVEPEKIAGLKARFLEQGALGTSMTGSGTAVFGLFDSPTAAGMCRQQLSRSYDRVYLVLPSPHGIELISD